jgi:hypothetical protein
LCIFTIKNYTVIISSFFINFTVARVPSREDGALFGRVAALQCAALFATLKRAELWARKIVFNSLEQTIRKYICVFPCRGNAVGTGYFQLSIVSLIKKEVNEILLVEK